MLVLSRKRGETIWIGDEICVETVELRPGHVRLGITAPQSLNIVRGELLPPDDPRQRYLPLRTDADQAVA